jgi:hypothetical protein
MARIILSRYKQARTQPAPSLALLRDEGWLWVQTHIGLWTAYSRGQSVGARWQS